ncbi:MAG: ABC transporter ATP-binding protein [Vicinamibacterales bacterium]
MTVPPGGLDARRLGKRFGAVDAVHDVSIAVAPGEIVGLLGPNGAGKTTTLRMLAGILAPDRGRVVVDGLDVHATPIEAKRRIGFLSGDTQLYQRLTPREVLAYFGRLYGLDATVVAARSAALVADLDMTGFADRPCGTLSSGQKQRANLARAFLHDPPLLILDEPTTALDVVSGQFIVRAIRQARDAGRAVLFSTHIMGEAEYLCDRIVLIHQGRVVDDGPLQDLLARAGRDNLTDAFLHYAGATA